MYVCMYVYIDHILLCIRLNETFLSSEYLLCLKKYYFLWQQIFFHM